MGRATKAELQKEIQELRRVGGEMAKLSYNFGLQGSLLRRLHMKEINHVCDWMWELWLAWDAIQKRDR